MKAFESLELYKHFFLSPNSLGESSNLYAHCMSENIKEYALEFGFSEEQIFFCPNPVDSSYFSLKHETDRLLIKDNIPIAKDDFVFIFSGRFFAKKT